MEGDGPVLAGVPAGAVSAAVADAVAVERESEFLVCAAVVRIALNNGMVFCCLLGTLRVLRLLRLPGVPGSETVWTSWSSGFLSVIELSIIGHMNPVRGV